MKKNIAIFASGGGSNAKKIMEHFQSSDIGNVVLMVCNKQQIGAYAVAETFGVPTLYMDRKTFYESEKLLQELKDRQVDFIVLAGFLWLIPSYLVKAFPNKILNIHPALLPKYGGKGMYGHHVHEAVKAAGEVESGMTIHYVNEHYDEGNIIFQSKCALEKDDSAEEIARKVLSLEHLYYPKVIEEVLKISNKKASLGQT
jgi:phosphoribosylglycinamide formyltransferase-1